MNLLLVSDTYPPDVNGVARTLQTLTRGMQAKGHRVTVVTTLEANGVSDGRHVTASTPLPGYHGLRMGWATRGGMEAIIESTQADVLYVATETPLGIAAIRGAHRLKVPVVSGFHTNFQTYLEEYHLPGLEAVAQAFLRTVHNHTSRTLTPSADTAAALREWGIANVGVLGRGVDTETFAPTRRSDALRSSWGAGVDTPVAIYVGRLAAEKNLPVVSASFRAMQKRHPGLVGVMVGDGPRAKAVQAEFPDFVYAGARHGEDLAAHYASGDVFVFPSLTETFGNVVLEAMASGLGVVAFDYAAPKLLIEDRVNGWRVPFGDEAGFLAQAATAVDDWNNASLRQSARATAMGHSWDRVTQQFELELAQAAGLLEGTDRAAA